LHYNNIATNAINTIDLYYYSTTHTTKNHAPTTTTTHDTTTTTTTAGTVDTINNITIDNNTTNKENFCPYSRITKDKKGTIDSEHRQ
jgi:hypothetical protein